MLNLYRIGYVMISDKSEWKAKIASFSSQVAESTLRKLVKQPIDVISIDHDSTIDAVGDDVVAAIRKTLSPIGTAKSDDKISEKKIEEPKKNLEKENKKSDEITNKKPTRKKLGRK